MKKNVRNISYSQIPRDKHIFQCSSFSCWNGVNPRVKKKGLACLYHAVKCYPPPSPTYFTIICLRSEAAAYLTVQTVNFLNPFPDSYVWFSHRCCDKMFILTSLSHVSELEMGFLCFRFSGGSPCRCVVVGR